LNPRPDIEQVTLADVIQGNIKNGYSPNSTESETGYWVLGLGALTDAGLNPSEIKPVEFNEKVQSALLEPGDFLISRSNTPDKVGRSLRFKGEIKNCSYPDLMMRFRPNTQLIDPSFLEYQLQSAAVRAYLKSCAAGSSASMVKITKSTVANTPIQLPPRAEQTKIAQILSSWDKAITTTERLLANSQQQKQALMQQLLTGQKRLHGFSDKWAISTLTNHCKVGTGAKDLQDKNDGGLYPFFVRSQNIERIDSYSFDGEAILIPGDGRVGEIFHYINGKFDFHQRVYKISNFSGVDGKYIYYLLCIFFKKEVVKNTAKATVDSLRMPVFTGMKIFLPSLPEQQKIAQVLSTADAEIANLQAQLATLKLEKKALMQQLLTGQRRVKPDADAAA
jgi:type I restriction enzyme S subunit